MHTGCKCVVSWKYQFCECRPTEGGGGGGARALLREGDQALLGGGVEPRLHWGEGELPLELSVMRGCGL